MAEEDEDIKAVDAENKAALNEESSAEASSEGDESNKKNKSIIFKH